jgi:hypothetical protein
MAFLVLVALPILCVAMGGAAQLEHSKSTQFCLSCHIMEPYGRSLHTNSLQLLIYQSSLPLGCVFTAPPTIHLQVIPTASPQGNEIGMWSRSAVSNLRARVSMVEIHPQRS